MQVKTTVNGQEVSIELTPEQLCSIQEQTCKPYKLQGGEWSINNAGVVYDYMSTLETKNFGSEFATKELAEQAAIEMRQTNRLRALRNELMGNKLYEPDWNDEQARKHYIFYSHENKEYRMSYAYTVQQTGTIHMPEKIAELICTMLNSGKFTL